MNYYNKYIKYKQKYLKLKNQYGGKLPYIEEKVDGNITKDYFPFDNNNFNYYFNDHSLIFNDKHNEDYLLNEKFELFKLDLNKKLDYINYNNKNIINNNNIYKLADQKINISSYEIIPFHLCLLSKYKILDNLYKKHINTIDNPNIIWGESINKDKIYRLYKLDEKNKKIYLLKNAKIVYKEIFTIYEEIYEIVNINNNYNILLKYSYCNKFLELLQLIYKIQLEILSYDSLNITTINKKNEKDIKIFDEYLIDEKYNLEDYIIVNIINIFISPISKLKNNFDIIYVFYKEEQFLIEIEQFLIEKEQLKIEKKQLKIEIEQFLIEKEQFLIEKEQLKIEKKQLKIEIEQLKIIEKESIIEKKIEQLKIKIEQFLIEKEQLKIEKKKLKIEIEKLKEDYNNAKQTYINISDTTLLFQYISKSMLHTEEEKKDFKNNVLQKITTNLENDIQQISYYLEDDIKQIKKLLLFNLYVDNIKDITPKFSYIFYATFIYYRINKPLISYTSVSNLYPINENNFVCNLIGINSDLLIEIMNEDEDEDEDESKNKPIFNSKYIKHPIHSYEGFLIKIPNGDNTFSYQNCTENGILEFIKILFWNQEQFVIKLPEQIDMDTEPLRILKDIFNDINKYLKNQINIKSLYENKEYHKKIHNLFSNHIGIKYLQNKYEVAPNNENFYKMLCIILNFDSIKELELYFNNINEYNPKITKITNVPDTYSTNINIYILNEILYTINITNMHVKVNSINNTDILKLIEYDYFNLLIYNTNILSKYSKETCSKYIQKYINNLSDIEQNDKNYEYLVELIIIKYPELSEYLYKIDINKYEKIILTAIEKNPIIICYLSNYDKFSLVKFLNKIVNNLDKENENYKEIVKCIFTICRGYNFNEIIFSVIKKNPNIELNEYYNKKYIENLIDIDKINLDKTDIYYKNIVAFILITLHNNDKLDKIKEFINVDKDYFFDNCLEIVMTITSTLQISSIIEYLFNNFEKNILEQIKNKPKILSMLNFNNEVMVTLCNVILNDLNKEHENYKDIVINIFITSALYKKLHEITKIKKMFEDSLEIPFIYEIIINAEKSNIYMIIQNLFKMQNIYQSDNNILSNLENLLIQLKVEFEQHKKDEYYNYIIKLL